jgi:hypothetical protein
MARAVRYAQITNTINEIKPKRIVEIGVWNGMRAVEMSKAALKHNDEVYYTGYDLFEEATPETNHVEMNAKKNMRMADVADRLARFQRECEAEGKKFHFSLVRGNTRETLGGKDVECDFAYVDGGHSVETIQNDYDAVKKHAQSVIFDDYYAETEQFDLDKVGCNRIIEEIDNSVVMPAKDPLSFEGVRDGWVQLVRVDKQEVLEPVEDKLFEAVNDDIEEHLEAGMDIGIDPSEAMAEDDDKQNGHG